MLKDIQQHQQYKILIIGEACLDIYVFGDVERLSPEAPVPVIKSNRTVKKEGMSENVAKNIQSMLPEAIVIKCQNEFERIKKTRFIESKSKYQLLRHDTEEELTPLSVKNIPEEKYDVVVISDYNKGYLKSKVIVEIFDRFRDSKIFVDTKRSDISCFKECIIKVNEKESKKLMFQNDTTKLITTLGKYGCKYLDSVYDVNPVDVHDVCGAGDTFLAGLVVRWLETKDMTCAIKTANNCASLSVTKLGCYTIKREEYENLRV